MEHIKDIMKIYLPTTKKGLVEGLKKYWFTKKEIEDTYKKHLNKNPNQAVYYAKKGRIRVLRWWLYSLKK